MVHQRHGCEHAGRLHGTVTALKQLALESGVGRGFLLDRRGQRGVLLDHRRSRRQRGGGRRQAESLAQNWAAPVDEVGDARRRPHPPARPSFARGSRLAAGRRRAAFCSVDDRGERRAVRGDQAEIRGLHRSRARAASARSQCRGAGQRARSHAAGGPCPPPARWLQPQPASPSAKHLGPFAAALSVRLHEAFPRHFRAGRGTHRPLTSRRDGARAAQ